MALSVPVTAERDYTNDNYSCLLIWMGRTPGKQKWMGWWRSG